MISRVVWRLELPASVKPSISMGSIMQGAMMELVSPDYVTSLHADGLRPYSQGLIRGEKNELLWQVCGLTSEFGEKVIARLVDKKALFLRQKRSQIGLIPLAAERFSYDEFMGDMMSVPLPPRYAEMIFRTPTGFRRNGRYAIFPEAELILASVLRRWNHFAPQLAFAEAELLPQLLSGAEIRRYQLRSEEFHVERVRITGFSGRLTLGLHGDELAQRLAALLISYAAYSGVGIKTALGMGVVESRLS